jgi:hypothetical protein
MLNIIPIEIRKELLEPLVHDLMIGPAMFELVEEDGPPLSGFVSEGGEDGVVEVLFDGFAVALVEVAGPVVGGALGAHVVACSVGCRLILRGVSIEQRKWSGPRYPSMTKRIHHDGAQ